MRGTATKRKTTMNPHKTPLEIYSEMADELTATYNAKVAELAAGTTYEERDRDAEDYELPDLESSFHQSGSSGNILLETEGLIAAGEQFVKALAPLGWTMDFDNSRYQTVCRPCREGDADYDAECLGDEISVSVRFSDHGNQSRTCGSKVDVNIAPGADDLRFLARYLTECDSEGEHPDRWCMQ